MANFVVNTTSDVVNANDKVLSLREAIEQANKTLAQDSITFSSSLTGAINVTKSLDVTSNLSITGNGKISVAAKPAYDVFIASKSTFAIKNITIGKGQDGIDVKDNNKITLTDVILQGNSDDGLDISGKNNTITVNGLTARNNKEDGVELDGASNTVTITNSTLTANNQGFHPDLGGDNNKITIKNTSLSGNIDDGADIDSNNNQIIFTSVRLNNNGDDGMSIDANNNKFTITGSTFQGNKDNGIEFKGKTNTVNLSSTTFSGNKKPIDDLGTGNVVSGGPKNSDVLIPKGASVGLSDDFGTGVKTVERLPIFTEISRATFSSDRYVPGSEILNVFTPVAVDV